jgi:hypothetical protein
MKKEFRYMQNFVDYVSRKEAAQLFRNFISGKISNDDFADSQPVTHDLAVGAIWDTAWAFYDDLKEHRLTKQHRLTPDERRTCVRWILFLHSDLLYEWPHLRIPGSDPALRIRSRIGNHFGWPLFGVSKVDAENFLNAGHYPVWPFLRVSDYKASLSSPRLLNSGFASN